MVLTNAQIYDSIPVLAQASEEKGMLGYAVAVNLRKLRGEILEYSRKRDELLAEYGESAGDGKYNFTAEKAAAFRAALQPFSELQITVDVMQVSVETFCSGNLTSGQMYALSWMVKEE